MFLVPMGNSHAYSTYMFVMKFSNFQPLQLSIDLLHFALQEKPAQMCIHFSVQQSKFSYFHFSVLITRWLRQHPRVLSMAFKKVNKISIK